MANQDKEKPIGIIIGQILNILLFIVSILIIIGVYYIVQIKVLKNDYSNLFGLIVISATFLFENKSEYDIIKLYNLFEGENTIWKN